MYSEGRLVSCLFTLLPFSDKQINNDGALFQMHGAKRIIWHGMTSYVVQHEVGR